MLPACFSSPFYEEKVSLPNPIYYQKLLRMTIYVRANYMQGMAKSLCT